MSTYALRELASDCGLKRSLAEVFGSQMAEQWLCYTIYQMVNGGSEDLYKDWAYHQILPTNAQKLSGQALRQQLLQECRSSSWEELSSKRTDDLKRKSRDASIDIPLRYGVFLTSVDDDHLTTVIDLWHGSIASAFVDHGTLTEAATYRYALERIKEASFPLDQIMLVPKHGDISTLLKLNTHFLTDCQMTENSAEDTWIQKEGQDISWDFNCQDTRHHVFSQSNVIELESDHGTTQTLQSHFSFDTAQESMAAAQQEREAHFSRHYWPKTLSLKSNITA